MDKKQKENQAGNEKISATAAVKNYLKSRKNAFFRMILFALLAFIFYRIGKAWKESFYVTLRFLYPISVMVALFQIFYFLPKWNFLKPRLAKLLKAAGSRILPVFQKLGRAFGKLGERFSHFRQRHGRNKEKNDRRKKKTGTTYRDEFLYAEGKGLFGRRRHHLKWRDMKTNRDKVRFYYMRYVLGTVKKGAPFGYHLTPEELKRLWKNPEGAEPLTGLYYRARYGIEEIEEQELADLQEYFHKNSTY